MKSFMASPSNIERKWYVVDAEGKTLGRLASEVAKVLRGKNKPTFTPHIDTGDYVIVVNAAKIAVTGKKLDQKIYYHHSDYVGGVAFDREGRRIGYGGGFYDRYLEKHPDHHTVGYAYAFQIYEHLPAEVFDRRVDRVLTENGFLKYTGEREQTK